MTASLCMKLHFTVGLSHEQSVYFKDTLEAFVPKVASIQKAQNET